MVLKTLMAAAGIVVALAGASAASATTYVGHESLNGATVDLSITTDGTLGVLEQHDISDYDIKITDANGSAELTPGVNSFVDFFENSDPNSPNNNAGGDFTATTSSVSFNFAGGVGGVLFINDDTPRAAFCLQNDGCFDFSGPAIFAGSHIDTSRSTSLETGEVVIGTAVSAAPEPATWALTILGVGMIGAALRSARRHAAAFA